MYKYKDGVRISQTAKVNQPCQGHQLRQSNSHSQPAECALCNWMQQERGVIYMCSSGTTEFTFCLKTTFFTVGTKFNMGGWQAAMHTDICSFWLNHILVPFLSPSKPISLHPPSSLLASFSFLPPPFPFPCSLASPSSRLFLHLCLPLHPKQRATHLKQTTNRAHRKPSKRQPSKPTKKQTV